MGLHVVFGMGQVGSLVVAELLRRGERVRVVRRTPMLIRGVEVVSGDVRDVAVRAAEGADVVYNCLNAPYHRWARELPPLWAAVTEAATHARLVVLDNLYMYGPASGPLTETTPSRATSRKGILRRDLGRALAAHPDVVIGRASDFLGPGVETSAVFSRRGWSRLLTGKPLETLGDSSVAHSFSYTPDVATGLVDLASGAPGIWHLPVVASLSVDALVARVARLAGLDARTTRMSPAMLLLLGVFVPAVGELREMLHQWDRPFVVDDAKARRAGMTSTPLDEALGATLAWARAREPRADAGRAQEQA